ncbi:MAG: DUF6142 family protein [bacterium]|nr:DUF6142 family protein [bacterium]
MRDRQKNQIGNRRRSVKFTNKKQSKLGVISLVFSILSITGLFHGLRMAFRMGENSGRLFGSIGMFAFLLEIVAFMIGIRSLKEEEVFRGIPKASVVVSVIILLLWIALYGFGIYVTWN